MSLENEKCHNCGKVGHLLCVCENHKTQRLDNTQYVSVDISDNQCAVDDDLFELCTVYSGKAGLMAFILVFILMAYKLSCNQTHEPLCL